MLISLAILPVLLMLWPCRGDNGVSTKIFQGLNADGTGHPWLARIESRDTDAICHASLLDKNWVLTAASCVSTGSAKGYRIIIGDNHREIPDGEQINRAKLIIEHELYVAGRPDYDIALIKLKRPANIRRKWIQPVPKLASQKAENAVLTQENPIKCRIAGWGEDLKGDKWVLPSQLQQRFVRFQADRTCDSVPAYNSVTNLCYGGTPCKGDEGTPIICYMGNTWVQVGMNVLQGSGVDCTMGQKVSIRISSFKKWLKTQMGNN